jgi:hypothetical protein
MMFSKISVVGNIRLFQYMRGEDVVIWFEENLDQTLVQNGGSRYTKYVIFLLGFLKLVC